MANARLELLKMKNRLMSLKNRREWGSIVKVDMNSSYAETRKTTSLKMKIQLAERKYYLAK